MAAHSIDSLTADGVVSASPSSVDPASVEAAAAAGHVSGAVSGATGAAEDDPTRHLLDLHQEQLSIEEAGMKAAVEEAFEMDIKQAAQMRGGTATGLSQKLLKAWTIPLANAIAEEQDLCIKLVSGLDRNAYGPLLLLARPQELAVLTITEALNLLLLAPTATRVVHLAMNIGQAFERHVYEQKRQYASRKQWSRIATALKEEHGKKHAQQAGAANGKGGQLDVHTKIKIALAVKTARSAVSGRDKELWGPRNLVKVGSVLLRLLLKTAKVEAQLRSSTATPSAPSDLEEYARRCLVESGFDINWDAADSRTDYSSGEAASDPLAAGDSMESGSVAEGATTEGGPLECETRVSGAGGGEGGVPDPLAWRGEITPSHLQAARISTQQQAADSTASELPAAHSQQQQHAQGATGAQDASSAPATSSSGGGVRRLGPSGKRAATLEEHLVSDLRSVPANTRVPASDFIVSVGSAPPGAVDLSEAVLSAADTSASGDAAAASPAAAAGTGAAHRESVQGGTKMASVAVPAFRHVLHKRGDGRRVGLILAHPLIHEAFSNQHARFASPVAKPMVAPPRPWRGPFDGGYLKQRVSFVRAEKGGTVQLDALKVANMPKVYQALSLLGETPWQINDFVLEVVRKVWNNGGGLAEIPSKQNLPLPERPTEAELAAIASPEERAAVLRKFNRELKRRNQQNADLYSLRCDMNLKLQVADEFKGRPIYFPHNIDFRGRAYPVPPHLNHMGADMARGLLTFAQSKPLGERGLWWLKVHVANLMGKDKVSLDDRAAFTEANLSEVFDSATKPLDGNGWWLKGDSPWQALAAMRELYSAYQCDNPAEYCSPLPVHQDGSCNGLQHYAALGRDEQGARAVNLVEVPDDDRPQDVYSKVLQLVLAKMEEDATRPLPPGLAESLAPTLSDSDSADSKWTDRGLAGKTVVSLLKNYHGKGTSSSMNEEEMTAEEREALHSASLRAAVARFLRGHIDRKVVKQTVMTSVYGVTFIGAREQIGNRLKEKFEAYPLPFEELDDAIYYSSQYLAKMTLESLGDLFAAADAIKKWLGDVTRLIGACDQPMSWVTPLGLPVIQPYRRDNVAIVQTVLQAVVVAAERDSLPVSAMKQRSAFPPNYVHSLDSTHMMLTALDCCAKGLTFTAVHDSYWTHARDVDTMSASLREQFISLYSLPLLEDLRQSLVMRFPHINFPDLPPRGTLDLNVVRQSKYFFN